MSGPVDDLNAVAEKRAQINDVLDRIEAAAFARGVPALLSEVASLRAERNALKAELDLLASVVADYPPLDEVQALRACASQMLEALRYLTETPEPAMPGPLLDPIVKHWSHTGNPNPKAAAYLQCPRCLVDAAISAGSALLETQGEEK